MNKDKDSRIQSLESSPLQQLMWQWFFVGSNASRTPSSQPLSRKGRGAFKVASRKIKS
jgi:hypothetical protein